METQKVVVPPNPTGSLKRAPPDVPFRPGSTVVVPHRPPPPIPVRPGPNNTNDHRKPRAKASTDETESNNSEVEATKTTKNKVDRSAETQMSESDSPEGQAYLEPVEVKDAVLRRPRNKPPPLPPRPTSTSSFHEEPDTNEARSVETQTSPGSPRSTQLNTGSKAAASTEEVYKKPPKHEAASTEEVYKKPPKHEAASTEEVYKKPPKHETASAEEVYKKPPKPEAIDKPQPKPKPKPRPRPKRTLTPDTLDEPYTEVPPPRPVVRGSPGGTRTRGETSSNESETNVKREESKPVNMKRTEPRVSQNEEEEDSNLKPSPVPAPRIKRASHSLGEMVERKLHVDNIDLTREPYTDSVSWKLLSCMRV